MKNPDYDVVLIGGSAGSLSVVVALLQAIPLQLNFTLIIIIHRPRNVASEMSTLLSLNRKGLKILEPEDKEPLRKGCIYLAPQNYHLLIEQDHTFSLDYSEPLHYSRPSLDVTFECAAHVFGSRCAAFVLSGANKDGAAGLAAISNAGGYTAVQDPATADYPAMPEAARLMNKQAEVLKPAEIVYNITHFNC